MKNYIILFKNEKVILEAETSYQAQLKGCKHFNIPEKKGYLLNVILEERYLNNGFDCMY
jgi:hypothetical protein